MVITKSSVHTAGLVISAIFVILVLQSLGFIGFQIFFYLSTIVMVRFILVLGRERQVFTLFLFSFLFLVYAITGFTLGLQRVGLRSWRTGLFDLAALENAIFIIGLNLLLFCVIAGISMGKRNVASNNMSITRPPPIGQFVQLCFSLIGSAIVVAYGMRGRNAVVESGSGGLLIGIGIIFSTLAIAAWLASPQPSRMMRAAGYLAIGASLFAAMNGYRYLAVASVLMIAARFILWSPNPLRLFFKLIPLAALLFWFVLFSGVARNLELSFFETLAATLDGSLEWSRIVELIGGSEELLLFSFVSVINSPIDPSIKVFLDAIIRILPTEIISELFDTQRSNDLIVATVQSDRYIDTNLNLGSFFFSEAALSLGASGTYIATALLAVVSTMIDRISTKDYFRLCIFLFLVSNTGNLAYYGLNTFLKLWFYAEFFSLALRLTLNSNKLVLRV